MAQLMRMPEILAGAAEAAVRGWLVAVGATVAKGQALAEIETEKAVIDLQSEADGVIGRLLVDEGATVPVGEPILVLAAPGDGDADIIAALAAAGARAAVPDAVPQDSPPVDDAAPAAEHPAGGGGTAGPRRLFASPLVRRLAAEHAIDLAHVVGTGPHGRVVRRDLERHLTATSAAPEPPRVSPSVSPARPARPRPTAPVGRGFADVPLDRMRRAIARRLTESVTTVPHFFLTAECRVDALLALRADVNAATSRPVSVNDLVVKATADAMAEVPAANAVWNGDSIRHFTTVDIGVAVAVDAGLVAPVLHDVHGLRLTELSAAIAALAARARSGRLDADDLEGGAFTVSNLGMYGTRAFRAIINPPQSGILAVGAARRAPVVDDDGALAVATVMTVTLSADHRVIDGALAAQWLAAFQRRIEHPLALLV